MKAMLAMFLVASCGCLPALAQETDHHQPAGPPGGYKLILENESVQVLRIRIAPHEKTPMHDVTPRVVLWMADAHFVDSFADGTTHEESRKAGDVEWVSARRHAGENIGETPMDFIAVVPKLPHASTGGDHRGSTTAH
jgi:quercetin dioxygenase-like cupin family protein